MRATSHLVTLALLMCALSGCVEKSKRLSKAERELLDDIVSTNAPSPQHELDIRYENKIRLLGYDLSQESAREGQPFKVTWYWQVNHALGDGWKIFTHLADAKGKSRINLDAVRPVRELYPVAEWKAGEFVKDVQEVTVPNDWDSEAAIFYIGFWNGPHRLHVSQGKNDGDNRAEGLRVPVVDVQADEGPPVPRLIARRANEVIELDGQLDESDWGGAQPTGRFVNTMSGSGGSFGVDARMLYDAENLYVAFEVHDGTLQSKFQQADDHLWEQDAVEVMLDPDGDGKNYFEIQVAPNGLVFDTAYESRRKPRPFGKVDWNSGTRAGVKLRGTLNDPDDQDDGYTVEMAIPWTGIATSGVPPAPPKAGDTWRINLYVMDLGKSGQRAVGWSPPRVADFHVPDRFGRVVFPEAAVAPKPEPEARAAAADPAAAEPVAAPQADQPEVKPAEAVAE